MKISWFLTVSRVEIPFQQHCDQSEGFFVLTLHSSREKQEAFNKITVG